MDQQKAREEQWAKFREDSADYLLTPDKAGNTALHVAANMGYDLVAADLIDQGHDINSQNKYGESIMQSAITALRLPEGDERAIQQRLLDAGADVSAKTTTNETLLHAAAQRGDGPMCEYLVDRRGMDVNAKNLTGNSPLHEAAWAGGEAIEALVERGADLSARNNQGKNARDVAQGPATEKMDQAMREQRMDKRVELPDPKAALDRLRNAPTQEPKLAKGRSL